MKKIVIAIDSFKGSVSSAEANKYCAEGVRQVFPDCEIMQVPVSDGGEGFAEAMACTMNSDIREVTVHGPLGNKTNAKYFFDRASRTAIMEMAQACGLTLVPEDRRNPLLASSFGTGEMILDAIRLGAEEIIIGLGGSATNDGGIGMLTALGIRFLDASGNTLPGIASDMSRIHDIDLSGMYTELMHTKFTVACDVQNPLLGPAGATLTFGAQKGADKDMLESMEKGMRNLVAQTAKINLPDTEYIPGAGAAGGLGFALMSYLNASLRHGIDIILDANRFGEIIRDASLVITGEGSLDAQTCNGKTAHGILCKAKDYNIPVIAISGQIKDYEDISRIGFMSLTSIINKPMSLQYSMQHNTTKNNITQTIIQLLNIIKYYTSPSQTQAMYMK